MSLNEVSFEELEINDIFKFCFDADNATLKKISFKGYVRIDIKDSLKYKHSEQSGKVIKQ